MTITAPGMQPITFEAAYFDVSAVFEHDHADFPDSMQLHAVGDGSGSVVRKTDDYVVQVTWAAAWRNPPAHHTRKT